MKKVLFTAIALSALLFSVDCCAGKSGNPGLNAKCEDECNEQGKRVDVQYSEETGTCQCSTTNRNV